MANFLVNNNFYQGTSQACIVDLTPPTFAGINFLDVESRGQIRAGWSTASDATAPIRYEVYIQASTATGLFNTANIIAVTPNLQYDIFTLPDGSFLENGVTYYVGVRAIDGVNNRDNSTSSISVISTGVLTAIDVYEVKASYSFNTDDELVVTLWGNKNDSLAVSPSAALGSAAFELYDSAGVAVSGVSGSGVTANAQGLFVFPSVSASAIAENIEHFVIKATINIDSESRVNFIPLKQVKPIYAFRGSFGLNLDQELIGAFWITSDGDKIEDTSRISSGHFHVHDQNGASIPGATESGITPNVDGVFVITPQSVPLDTQSNLYYVHVRASVDGKLIDDVIYLRFDTPEYDVKAQFSINASNELKATFWVTANNDVRNFGLGVANYTVYDSAGVAVAGLTETGITADVNGRFQITPVSAILLTDLTHYSVKIGIVCDGLERVAYKGFTLLGT